MIGSSTMALTTVSRPATAKAGVSVASIAFVNDDRFPRSHTLPRFRRHGSQSARA